MVKELNKKYKEWHDKTDEEWKRAVIDKCKKDGSFYAMVSQDLDWIYDDCIDSLFDKTTKKIKNLAKKMGYKEIPCLHCRNIIKYWDSNNEWRWSPDKAHLF
jgi:hypothetical protein